MNPTEVVFIVIDQYFQPDIGEYRLDQIPGDLKLRHGFGGQDFIPETLPKPPGFERNHHAEWVNACKGGPKALSNFDYAGSLTEAVLLGNVALRAGKKILWDAKKLKITNAPEANQYLRTEYRKGWRV